MGRSKRCCVAVLWLAAAVPVLAQSADSRLIDAVARDDVAMVRTLLTSRVDVNAAAADGATALHRAAQRDNAEIAGLLLAAGAKLKDL